MKNSQFAVVFKSTELFKPFLISPLFIAEFGVEAFAAYALVVTLTATVSPFIDAGVLSHSQRVFYNSDLRKIDNIASVLIFQYVLAFVFFPVLIGVYVIFFTPDINDAVIFSIYAILFATSNSLNGYLRAADKFGRLVVCKALADTLDVVVLYLYCSRSEEYGVDLFVYLAAVRCFYYLCQLRCVLSPGDCFFSVNKKFIISFGKEFYKNSLKFVPLAVVGSMAANIDRFVIESVLDRESLGTYIVILQYSFYLKLVAFPVTFTMLAPLSSAYNSGGCSGMMSALKKPLLFTSLLTLFACSAFWVLRNFIYESFIGVNLNEYSYDTLALIVISIVVMNVNSVLLVALTAMRKISGYTWLLALLLIFSSIANYFGVSAYGYIFCGVVWLVSSLVTLSYSVMVLVGAKENEKNIICR